MRRAGLEGVTRRRRHRTAKRDPATISDDLVKRQSRPDGPDQLWVADITQHPTDEGWIYCAVVIDAWSRLVVGHAIGDHLRTELVVDALDTARWRRQPDPGLVFHSDHGTQYTSWAFGRRLRDAGCSARWAPSATRRTTPWPSRSLPRCRPSSSTAETVGPPPPGLANAIFEWIEVFYNRDRRHSTLGYLNPSDYDQRRPTAPPEAA